jgi:hypothetical protein
MTGEVSYNLCRLTSVSGSVFHSLDTANKKHNINMGTLNHKLLLNTFGRNKITIEDK